jgi:hypothetical protein
MITAIQTESYASVLPRILLEQRGYEVQMTQNIIDAASQNVVDPRTIRYLLDWPVKQE